jgi:hypothetical protein
MEEEVGSQEQKWLHVDDESGNLRSEMAYWISAFETTPFPLNTFAKNNTF